jgi:hypothetical protein
MSNLSKGHRPWLFHYKGKFYGAHFTNVHERINNKAEIQQDITRIAEQKEMSEIRIPCFLEDALIGYLSPEYGGRGFFIYLPGENDYLEYCHNRIWAKERLRDIYEEQL